MTCRVLLYNRELERFLGAYCFTNTLASEASNNRGLRILQTHTVDFRDQEFQEKMRHIKIIELKAELEAKQALLEALIREKQQVSLPRRACIPEELHPGQL